ncbi:MAG: DUF6268 family outer membrane beta-barrel protein [Candidatus Omnitrophota bacterium]
MIKKIFVLLLLFCFSSLNNCFAFEHGGWHIHQESKVIGASDAKGINGEVGLKDFSFSLNKESFLYQDWPVNTGFSFNRYFINNSSSFYLPDTLESKSINLGAYLPLPYANNQDLFLKINFIPIWNTAEEHDFNSDVFRFNSVYFLGYRSSDDFILAVGIISQPEYDNPLIPFVGVFYRMDEKISFNFLSPNPSINYSLTKNIDAFLEFGFLGDEFEIAGGEYQGDILSVSNYFMGIGTETKITKDIKLKLSFGEVFWQEYEYLKRQTYISVADSGYFSCRLKGRF